MEDVKSTQSELRRKQDRMSHLLKEAHLLLAEEEGSQVPGSNHSPADAAGSEKEGRDTLTAMVVDDDKQELALHPSSSPQNFFGLNRTNQPRLTDYDASDSDSDEDAASDTVDRTQLMQGWSRYMPSTRDTATLMSVVENLKISDNPSPLIDYPDSDEEQKETALYDKLAEAVAIKTKADNLRGIDGKSLQAGMSAQAEPITEWTTSKTLDDMMGVLIRLRMGMERMVQKNIFPYNAQPLLKVMHQCEAVYERAQGHASV